MHHPLATTTQERILQGQRLQNHLKMLSDQWLKINSEKAHRGCLRRQKGQNYFTLNRKQRGERKRKPPSTQNQVN